MNTNELYIQYIYIYIYVIMYSDRAVSSTADFIIECYIVYYITCNNFMHK